MTLTKSWLQKQITDLEATRDEIPFGLSDDEINTLAAFKAALAGMEAEPVVISDDMAYAFHHAFSDSSLGADEVEEIKTGLRAAFANVPAPQPLTTSERAELENYRNAQQVVPVSVPDDMTPKQASRSYCGEVRGYRDGWNACRAAMLQGKAEPVTPACKLPANTTCKEAPEYIWLQTAGIWPENGEFGELTWCSDSQHQDDTLYVRADVVIGNSPVIPDGWVMVPVEPTEDMIIQGFESEPDESFSEEKDWLTYEAMSGCQQAAHRAKLCWAAMIAAAPQQEA